MKGGSYSSATTYGNYVNGDLNAQDSRVLSNSSNHSNIIVGAQGQNSGYSGAPSSQQLSSIQNGGRRKRRCKSKNKKGGFLGAVINQAIVPFGILGMQQSYRRNKYNNKNTNKRRFYSKRRRNYRNTRKRY